MAFKLTYRDGQDDDYDDDTAWTVEDGVLKMGREAGKWTVLVSPSHWATIELQPSKSATDDEDKGEDSGRDEGKASADSKDKDDSKDKAKSNAEDS